MQGEGCRVRGNGTVLHHLLWEEGIVWVVQIASNLAPVSGGKESWGSPRTTWRGMVTTLGKAAARDDIGGWLHGAPNHPQPLVVAHTARDGLQKFNGVGMVWLP